MEIRSFRTMDPLVSNEAIMNQAPSPEHWMGTDTYGRDVLSRVIYGARPVLLLAPISVLVSMTIGILLGLPAAYYRGKSDETIMRMVDVIMSFPVILIYAIGLPSWPTTEYCRCVTTPGARYLAGAQPGPDVARILLQPSVPSLVSCS
jgi:hypothetical protein